eukprot:3492234-Rhodomonas_salina.1
MHEGVGGGRTNTLTRGLESWSLMEDEVGPVQPRRGREEAIKPGGLVTPVTLFASSSPLPQPVLARS